MMSCSGVQLLMMNPKWTPTRGHAIMVGGLAALDGRGGGSDHFVKTRAMFIYSRSEKRS